MIENLIENIFQELTQRFPTPSQVDFSKLYNEVKPPRLAELFSNIHGHLVDLFKSLNQRLPTGDSTAHFWAAPSRSLIDIFDLLDRLSEVLENTEFDFEVESYTSSVIDKCKGFLQSTLGSQIPENMAKIIIKYTEPIFIQGETIRIVSINSEIKANLKQIGSGSYGIIYKYFDEFYQIWFALKRAKTSLDEKELERFKNEYEQLSNLNSPYVLKVYCYNDDNNEFIMELLDYSLEEYFRLKNNNIPFSERKRIGFQIIKAIEYIHSKGLLHRDICPRNILIKCYDDTVIVKVSDFGLIKTSVSTLTSIDSDIKGSYNDPDLETVGFHNYSLKHEIYALTKTLRFVLTGITNFDRDIKESIKQFAEKGMCPDSSRRYQSIQDVEDAFKQLKEI